MSTGAHHLDASPAIQLAGTATDLTTDVWRRYAMALDEVADRMGRITAALKNSGVPFALVDGQAVALWVATKDPAAVRTTKDVDLLLRRTDLGPAQAAARAVEMDYFESMGAETTTSLHYRGSSR